MFDPTAFEKLQEQLQQQIERVTEKAIHSFNDAFKDLPEKMKEAFDAALPNKFARSMHDLADEVQNVDTALQNVEDRTKFLKDQAQIVEKLIEAVKQQGIEEKEVADELVKQARTIDDRLDAEEYLTQLAEKNADAQVRLGKMMSAFNVALTATQAKQAQLLIQKKQMVIQQQRNVAMQRAFGMNLKQLTTKMQSGLAPFRGLRGILNAISVAAGMLVKQMLDGFASMRRAGLDAFQAGGEVLPVLKTQFVGFTQGVIASNKEFAQSYGGLANRLGTLDVGRDLTVEATRLSTQYGLSNQEATGLVGQLERMSNFSDQAATSQLKQARALAYANRIPIGTLMKDMADNSEIFATYATRGVDAFARGVIKTREMGTNIQSMSRVADKMVGDFEGSLRMQAEIQTILPGLDLSRVMYASQFGTEAQVATELKNALHQSGLQSLDQLPRSVRMQLSQSLGLPYQEIQNLLGNGAPDKNGLKAADRNFSDTTHSFANSISDLITSNSKLTDAIGLLTAAVISGALGGGGLGGILRGGGKLLSKIPGVRGLGGKIAGIFGKGAAEEGAAATAKLGAEELGGKVAAKAGIKLAGSELGNIPLLGPFIAGASSFGLSMAMHEGVGKALSRGVGSGLGTLIPGMGALGGGIAGDLIGGGAYDLASRLFGHKPTATGADMPATAIQTQNGAFSGTVSAAANSATAPTVLVENKKVEDLLRDLLKVARQGQNIYMDGKKVGKTVIESYSRS